jgi:hypothetical protein
MNHTSILFHSRPFTFIRGSILHSNHLINMNTTLIESALRLAAIQP